MSARSALNTLAAIVGLAIGAALYGCGAYTLATPARTAATIGTAVTVERAPSCTILADGADSPDADAQWAALVAEHGTLDYIGGAIVTMTGEPIGYSLAEDSTIWSDPSCMFSVTTTTHR